MYGVVPGSIPGPAFSFSSYIVFVIMLDIPNASLRGQPRTAQDGKLNVIIYNQCMLLQFLITK